MRNCIVPIFLVLASSAFLIHASGGEGIKGRAWTDEEALIIRDKLRLIWRQPLDIFKDFDIKEDSPGSLDFVYDPDLLLSTYNCTNCDHWMEGTKRKDDLSFTERKAIRLAFHDCIPYKDGTGGCDGCLNFNENEEDNLGLEHSAAILERLYTDMDFPPVLRKNVKTLPDSPKNLGISRADLWAFAGLVALDEYLQFTKSQCKYFNWGSTCGDQSTPCYSPLPSSYQSMFKTGRQDCQARQEASSKQQYRASKVEAHPHQGFNGEMTVNYFNEKFNMSGKEALALLGAHTVGHFNPISIKVDYSWTREIWSNRSKLFNNEYYKNLALRPAKVKDQYCQGTMDGQPGQASVVAFANPFLERFDRKNPWAESAEKPGVLSWRLIYYRGPTCDVDENVEEEDKDQWEFFKQEWKDCCEAKAAGCVETSTCPSKCTKGVQGRVRMTSPEMGLYLDWKIDENGLPYGCDVFNLPNGRTDENFRDIREVGESDCPRQKLLENGDKGMQLWKRVENYADDQEKWLEDFVASFAKMQDKGSNGLEIGPSSFWRHNCCFETQVLVESSHYKSTKAPTATDCQSQCSGENECQFFAWRREWQTCSLYKEQPAITHVDLKRKTTVFGPKSCDYSEQCQLAYMDFM